MTWPLRTGAAIVTLQHAFLSPLVILGIPPPALLNQNLQLAVVVAAVGLAGMLSGKRALVLASSLSLLFWLVWGKAVSSILRVGSQDTAVLLTELISVLIFMEASLDLLEFSRDSSRLKRKEDELSRQLGQRMEAWVRSQLLIKGRLGLIALGLSLSLLLVGGVTSVPSNQLVFYATLPLLAVLIMLFLMTHRREPETN